MTNWFSNPLVIFLTAIIILIVILAIFRKTSPELNMGAGINAHIGDLKAKLELEAYRNYLEKFEEPETGAIPDYLPKPDEDDTGDDEDSNIETM